MYTINEKKSLARATLQLLRKVSIEIKKNNTNFSPSLTKLELFTHACLVDSEKAKRLGTLILAGMWQMFEKELKS